MLSYFNMNGSNLKKNQQDLKLKSNERFNGLPISSFEEVTYRILNLEK